MDAERIAKEPLEILTRTDVVHILTVLIVNDIISDSTAVIKNATNEKILNVCRINNDILIDNYPLCNQGNSYLRNTNILFTKNLVIL